MNRRQELVRQLLLDCRLPAPGQAGEAFAPVNVALAKYWGKRDAELNLPHTDSLSVALPAHGTHTRIVCHAGPDQVWLNGQAQAPGERFAQRLSAFLDLFRSGPEVGFAVDTRNDLPTAAGLASSASGFAALVLALDALAGWQLPRPALSILARLGSGSACRSLHAGFVCWHRGERSDGLDSFAEPLAATWPGLCLGVLPIATTAKPLGSREAMQASVAPGTLYRAWPELLAADLHALREAIATRDFARLGQSAEHNALSMHATMLSAWPPVCYWLPETVAALHRLWQARAAGLAAYATMDAGPNPKLLFLASAASAVRQVFPHLQTFPLFPKE